jgi:hypothetical protein
MIRLWCLLMMGYMAGLQTTTVRVGTELSTFLHFENFESKIIGCGFTLHLPSCI